MIFEKLNEMVSLKQIKGFEKIIMFNSHERKQATNDFEMDFYKILYNAVYGNRRKN